MRVGSWVVVSGLVAACGDSGGAGGASGSGSSTGASETQGATDDASGGTPTGSDSSGSGGASEASVSGESGGETTDEPTTAVAMTESMTTEVSTSTGLVETETGSSGGSTGETPPVCGDGEVDDGEACDDGVDNGDDAKCSSACVVAVCGDGLVLAGEEGCDDGNADNSDDCTELCAAPSCTDGLVSGDETDLECGGESCQGCTLGQMCKSSGDCAEGDCFGGTCTVPLSCKQLEEIEPDAESGVYDVDPDGDGEADLKVFCEMMKGGGGWTLVAYNYDVPGTFLKGNYHPLNVDTSPVTPTSGKERAFDPADVGVEYSEIGFFTDDVQWSDPSRNYRGFWIGDNVMSTYDLNSAACQLLRPSDIEVQWDGELVYHGGDGANDNGCIGGGSLFTNNLRPSCDDGGGCVTVNTLWPTNGADPLWGWNYLVWHGGAPANNLYKKAAAQQKGLYAYYVR